ncbi:tRNA pseudouridine(38-40) synthase TruA [Halobacterium sp. R2-5]|uniref:tRNA pseudouridine(38-40) synthase TruA n=1 Tax=Halobacterium sp. R2-5 TaxID=2715751 RepID=UPI00141F34DA|nr:tRNA pseudouridine(38-40) synthase TruA [Halobacterium sp. R2-5]NIB99802.1 tRNA pseudouridine(38-40) synthase TruA [Halobacterium sp. R2-5]
MPRRAFRVAYDGRPYYGFQRQPEVTTVEGELFGALRRLDVFEGEKPPGYAAAGRTDAGVSARAQTIALDAPEWLTPSALNGELPDLIHAWAHADAPSDFHATHDANWRAYRYFWHAPERSEGAERASGVSGSETPGGSEEQRSSGGAASHAEGVDDQRAAGALGRLLGERDFHNLTPDDENTVRELSGGVSRENDFLVVTLRASGFCRELVRRVVSLVQAVAAGADFERIDRVLGDERVDGPEGVPPAPAGPLVLHDVDYGLDFEREARAAAAVRETFRELREERRALARVAGHVADSV